MYARTSLLRFKPDSSDEALGILRDVILPQASQQSGFRGMLVMRTEGDREIVISFWETEADLLASGPPAAISAPIARLGELIAESRQDIHEVVLSQMPQTTGRSSYVEISETLT